MQIESTRFSEIDLSKPDNSELHRGRPLYVEALWWYLGLPLLKSRLIPVSRLKCLVLRLFGARIGEGVYLKPGLCVKFPWNLEIGAHCWIGEDVWIDNLAHVKIESNVCVSQGAYICTGNHDWTVANMKLFSRPVILERGSWVGARSTICPGVSLGQGAIAAVGSIVSRSIPAFEVWAGNPAGFVRNRNMKANVLTMRVGAK